MVMVIGTNASEGVTTTSRSPTVNLPTTNNDDWVYMYGGDDVVYAGSSSDTDLDGPGGHVFGDLVYGGAGNDYLIGEGGIDYLYGEGHNDYLIGGAGNDNLYGGYGNDTLGGSSGNDTLQGEADPDRLIGGLGKDTLAGGLGADKFQFSKGDTGHGTANADVITDFKRFEGDQIDLGTPINVNVSYFGGPDSTPEAGEVSYWFSGNDTVVSFNDGGVHDIVLQNLHLYMIASDFVI